MALRDRFCGEDPTIAAARMVDIFEEGARRLQAARTKIDGQHHVGIGSLGPIGKFMNSDMIALRTVPGEIEADRSLFSRANAIFPVIG